MTKQKLINKIKNVEKIANTSKIKRLFLNPYKIDKDGKIRVLDSIQEYIRNSNLESDNIVFIKPN